MKVRKNIDVSGASIWKRQRDQKGGRDEQMGGRKIVSKVEREEKLFCQMHPHFHARERLFPSEELGYLQMAAATQEMGLCQVSSSKIKTSVKQRGENSHISQSAVCVCLCC